MRIDRVRLAVPDPGASAAFHRDVLGLPVLPDREGTAVGVGWSRLVLVADVGADPSAQHLAITVPGDAGAAAHDWLRERVALLGDGEGTRFEGPPGWDATSTYFLAPDGTVLELIARRRRPERLGRAAFGPEHLLGISEVGVPVASVAAAREELGRVAGLGAFAGPGSEAFAAVGDDGGLLVLVAPGRVWFPTADHRARRAPLAVAVSGTGARGEVLLNPDALLTYD